MKMVVAGEMQAVKNEWFRKIIWHPGALAARVLVYDIHA